MLFTFVYRHTHLTHPSHSPEHACAITGLSFFFLVRLLYHQASAIGVDTVFAPVVNMMTDPRFGRLQEGFGYGRQKKKTCFVCVWVYMCVWVYSLCVCVCENVCVFCVCARAR